jgi:hypothetical protein
MFKQISTQATAFGLAALVTLATLGSMNGLAQQGSPAGLAQATDAPVQQVVVTGQRATRG